ncbi:MAG: hypothetical protein JW950_14455 [Deltaproteobacteria bacterium]|nr:hypothetical protein [Deltaproteobacteria bacterium]
MNRLMVIVVGLVFLFTSAAIAADKPAAAPKAAPAKAATAAPAAEKTAPAPVKVAKMKATGVVTEVTDAVLKIDVKVKGKVEAKEFTLEKPVKAKVGDKVTVIYAEKDGKMVAMKVAKAAKKVAMKKKIAPLPEPAAAPEPAK